MAEEEKLARSFLELLSEHAVDFTLAFRYLCDAAENNNDRFYALFEDTNKIDTWLSDWRLLYELNASMRPAERTEKMRKHNPWVIPRNHLVEQAIATASDNNDYSQFNRLLTALLKPFEEEMNNTDLSLPADIAFTKSYQTFCGT